MGGKTTILLDEKSRAAAEFLRQRGWNVSAYIRMVIRQKAEEVERDGS